MVGRRGPFCWSTGILSSITTQTQSSSTQSHVLYLPVTDTSVMPPNVTSCINLGNCKCPYRWHKPAVADVTLDYIVWVNTSLKSCVKPSSEGGPIFWWILFPRPRDSSVAGNPHLRKGSWRWWWWHPCYTHLQNRFHQERIWSSGITTERVLLTWQRSASVFSLL